KAMSPSDMLPRISLHRSYPLTVIRSGLLQAISVRNSTVLATGLLPAGCVAIGTKGGAAVFWRNGRGPWEDRRFGQFSVAPDSFMIGAHLAISALMCSESSSGVL